LVREKSAGLLISLAMRNEKEFREKVAKVSMTGLFQIVD
jgi:hypothetical protein